MSNHNEEKPRGCLYIVATPIGNLGDISQRAINTLKTVQLVAAEDTRHSGQLMRHFGVSTPMQAYHEHNEQQQTPRLLERLKAGENIALISDAGTPLISDPGFNLVRAAIAQGVCVSPIPGASSIMAALSVAGLPTDRFIFEGFLPAKSTGRRRRLEALRDDTRTLVLLESSHRILASLEDMRDVMGTDRQAVIARELTKNFETILSGTLQNLAQQVAEDSNQQKGEFVVMLHGAPQPEDDTLLEAQRVMGYLLSELPIKKAAALAASITGSSKNKLYKWGLEQKKQVQ